MIGKAKYEVGQWVCAQRGGELVYSVIRYVRKSARWPNDWEYVTDHGTLSQDAIVEAR